MSQKTSIVTVCYNSEKTIAKTFESVLSQTTLPYEYVVIDGASRDNTVAIINNYKQMFESKNVIFKFISESDKGLYDAMNKATNLITGEWIHYLNSDDKYTNNNVLEKIHPYLSSKDVDVIYGNMMVCYENGHIKKIKPGIVPRPIAMFFTCPIQQPTAFTRFSVLRKFRFDTSFKNSADYKLWVELINKGIKCKYVNIDVTSFKTGGASGNLSNMNKENIRLFKELNLPLGAIIHRCYIHMIILSYLKKRYPNFHHSLKKILKRN